MPAGLQVFNQSGVLQIDETTKNPRLVTSGSVAKGADNSGYGYYKIDLGAYGINLNTEIPLLLLRPATYGTYVGGVFVTKQYGTVTGGNFFLLDASDSAFDYSIFSQQVAGVRDPGNLGLQVFNAAGEITYDTNQAHTRILGNLYHAATASFPYPYSFGISGFSGMPWVVANPLVSSFKGGQDSPAGVFMKVNSPSSVTVDLRVVGAAGTSFASVYGTSIAQQADPYNGQSATFSMADWA